MAWGTLQGWDSSLTLQALSRIFLLLPGIWSSSSECSGFGSLSIAFFLYLKKKSFSAFTRKLYVFGTSPSSPPLPP